MTAKAVEWIRFHARDLIVLGVLSGMVGLLVWALRYTVDDGESQLLHILIGGVLAGIGNVFIRWIYRSEAYQQGSYTERAKVIQELLREARLHKQYVVDGWERSGNRNNTALVGLSFHNRPCTAA